MITTSHWLFFSFSILLVSGSFLLSKSLACLSNSLICLKRQDQIIFLIGNLKADKKGKGKGKYLLYMHHYNSHTCMGFNPWAILHLLRKGGDGIWYMEHLQKKNKKNTHTKHQQQQYHIPIGFWTYDLIHHPILVQGRSAIRPNSHWLRQGIYVQSLALFRHNFQASVSKVGPVLWAETTNPRRETVAHLRSFERPIDQLKSLSLRTLFNWSWTWGFTNFTSFFNSTFS